MNKPDHIPMPPTVDEHFELPTGSIDRFVQKKDDYLASIEQDRKDRIRASRKAACELSWAA